MNKDGDMEKICATPFLFIFLVFFSMIPHQCIISRTYLGLSPLL
jgi:hypothetical protein